MRAITPDEAKQALVAAGLEVYRAMPDRILLAERVAGGDHDDDYDRERERDYGCGAASAGRQKNRHGAPLTESSGGGVARAGPVGGPRGA